MEEKNLEKITNQNEGIMNQLGSRFQQQLDRSPAFPTSDDFIRSKEIIRKKWPIYEVIHHFVLMISSERKNSR